MADPWRSWLPRVVLTPRGVVVAAALCGFALSAFISVSRGWPVPPEVHDEMSYLLGADTFAHGRLSNPTPPLWEHFETFHVLMRPTYASKYPPAQSLFLAAGQVLTGYAIVGVWLGTSLMCAALAWMLLGWVRPPWALWGTLVTLFLIAAIPPNGYWIASYWGGNIPALGGALVYGGARRIARFPSRSSAVWFAIGLGLLSLSRPFEGGLVALPPVASAVWWFVKGEKTALRWRLEHVFAPCVLVLGAVGAFWLTYDKHVTGNAYRIPYLEYEAQYSPVSTFRFMGAPNDRVAYHNGEMEEFYRQELRDAKENRALGAAVLDVLDRISELRDSLFSSGVIVLVVLAAMSFPFKELLVPVLGVALVVAGSLLVTWHLPHYVSPMVGPWALLLTTGARRLNLLSRQRHRTGATLVWCLFAIALLPAVAVPVRVLAERRVTRSQWYVQRDSIARALTARGQRHLVLVSYGPSHATEQEWVYNAADIDRSPLVWARSLSTEQDAALVSHFHDRVAWRVQVDSGRGPYSLTRTTP